MLSITLGVSQVYNNHTWGLLGLTVRLFYSCCSRMCMLTTVYIAFTSARI